MNISAFVLQDADENIEQQTLAVVNSLTTRAQLLPVTCPAEAQQAGAVLVEIATRRKVVEEWFAPLVEAAHKAHKALTQRRSTVLAQFVGPESIIKDKLGQFRQLEERARRAAEQQAAVAAQEAARAAQMAQAEAAMDSGDLTRCEAILDAPAPPVLVAPVAVPAPTVIAGTSFVETWTFEVTDLSALPREYMVPDTKKIGAVVRALKGECRIPGVRVWADTSVRTRTA